MRDVNCLFRAELDAGNERILDREQRLAEDESSIEKHEHAAKQSIIEKHIDGEIDITRGLFGHDQGFEHHRQAGMYRMARTHAGGGGTGGDGAACAATRAAARCITDVGSPFGNNMVKRNVTGNLCDPRTPLFQAVQCFPYRSG